MFKNFFVLFLLLGFAFLSCNGEVSKTEVHKLTGSWKLNRIYLSGYDKDISETRPVWCSMKILIDSEGNAEFFNYDDEKVLVLTEKIPVTFFEEFYVNSKDSGKLFWFFDKNHEEDGIGFIDDGKIKIYDIDETIFCEYVREYE